MEKINKKLPDSPGVYFFRRGRQILYIGKATSLRDRVRSYFNADVIATRGSFIIQMVDLATSIAYRTTDSVLEAVILEVELIKKYKPKYNSREKDDKSFQYIIITKEKFPRVLLERGRTLATPLHRSAEQGKLKLRKMFGPYPSGGELREALRIIRKIFPFRDRCTPLIDKPCFNRQIGLCPGVCSGEINVQEYTKQIKNIELFLSGKKRILVNQLKKEMRILALAQKFEEADKVKRKIFALEHINDVSLIKRESIYVAPETVNFRRLERIEAYDVAHLGGSHNVGVMTVIENGNPNRGEYRKFKIRGNYPADDLRSLREVMERRLNHPEWQFPDLVVVDGGKLQVATATEALKRDGTSIPVVGVVKDEHHKPKNIIGNTEIIKKYEQNIFLANFEAHRFAITYHRKLRSQIK